MMWYHLQAFYTENAAATDSLLGENWVLRFLNMTPLVLMPFCFPSGPLIQYLALKYGDVQWADAPGLLLIRRLVMPNDLIIWIWLKIWLPDASCCNQGLVFIILVACFKDDENITLSFHRQNSLKSRTKTTNVCAQPWYNIYCCVFNPRIIHLSVVYKARCVRRRGLTVAPSIEPTEK